MLLTFFAKDIISFISIVSPTHVTFIKGIVQTKNLSYSQVENTFSSNVSN